MTIYPPSDGYTAEEMKKGIWSLDADVRCSDCKREYSLAYVGGIGGTCPRCGGRCF